MIGKKTVPKTTRTIAITKALPDGDFGKAELEKRIRGTKIDGAGINNRQSVQEYIGLLLDTGMIEKRRQDRYRVTKAAKTAGQIVITVESTLRVPLIRDLLERALQGIDGVTIIDEVIE